MNLRLRAFGVIVTLVGLFALMGCGRGGKTIVQPASGGNPGAFASNGENLRDGFSLVALKDLPRDVFTISAKKMDNGDTVVSISAMNANDLPYGLFELKYDATRYTPVKADIQEFFGHDGVFTASFMSKPGSVGIAMVPVHFDRKPGASGSGLLASVSFVNEPFRAVSYSYWGRPPGTVFKARESSVALQGRMPDGVATSIPGDVYRLSWNEMLVGDGDHSGEVSVSDITPIGLHYLETTAANPAITVVDYNESGEIGVSDITPIALNYMSTIAGYNIYSSPTFDLSAAVLDGSIDRPSRMPDLGDPAYGPLGYYTYDYIIANRPPLGATRYYFVVPYSNEYSGNEEGPIDPTLNPPVEVLGTGDPMPQYLVGFTLEITANTLPAPITAHLKSDDSIVNRYGNPLTKLDFYANETYQVGLVSADLDVWSPADHIYVEGTYLPSAYVFDDTWLTDIAWSVANVFPPTSSFDFDRSSGSPLTCTAGPDDPFTFDFVATLVGRTLTLPVSVSLDPWAPALAAIEPGSVESPYSQDVSIYCNMNELPRPTKGFTLDMIPALDLWDATWAAPPQFPFSFVYAADPQNIANGEFAVFDEPNPTYGTAQAIKFKFPWLYDYGAWRFRAGNRQGRRSSINHPPSDGTTPNNVIILYSIPKVADTVPLRISPETPDNADSRLMIYFEHPYIQKYPSVVDPLQDADRYNSTWIRTPQDETGRVLDFFMPFWGDPINKIAPTPYANVFDANPWRTGVFAPDPATWVGTTNERLANDNGITLLSDWGIRWWNSLCVDTLTLPAGRYWLAAFVYPDDAPLAGAEFQKVDTGSPDAAPPEVLAIADADIVFDNGRDGVQDSEWPVIEYPDGNGVVIDWAAKTYPAIFVAASHTRSDAENPGGTLPEFHDTSIVIYADDGGGSPGAQVARIEGGLTAPGDGQFTLKPYEMIPAVPPPPLPPGIGDPPVEYVDYEAAWMLLPLSSVPPGILGNGKWFVGVDRWDAVSLSWVASAPLAIPFTIVNIN